MVSKMEVALRIAPGGESFLNTTVVRPARCLSGRVSTSDLQGEKVRRLPLSFSRLEGDRAPEAVPSVFERGRSGPSVRLDDGLHTGSATMTSSARPRSRVDGIGRARGSSATHPLHRL